MNSTSPSLKKKDLPFYLSISPNNSMLSYILNKYSSGVLHFFFPRILLFFYRFIMFLKIRNSFSIGCNHDIRKIIRLNNLVDVSVFKRNINRTSLQTYLIIYTFSSNSSITTFHRFDKCFYPQPQSSD